MNSLDDLEGAIRERWATDRIHKADDVIWLLDKLRAKHPGGFMCMCDAHCEGCGQGFFSEKTPDGWERLGSDEETVYFCPKCRQAIRPS